MDNINKENLGEILMLLFEYSKSQDREIAKLQREIELLKDEVFYFG